MNKILNWLSGRDGCEHFMPSVHGPKLVSLKEAEHNCWALLADIRYGNGNFVSIPLDKRLLMCSGVEYSIIVIQSMIEEINNLPK